MSYFKNEKTLKDLFGNKPFSDLKKLLDPCCNGGLDLVIKLTYSELMNRIINNQLVEGQLYLITDFRTVHYIQFSGGGLGSEDIHTGQIEPMIVQALGTNKVAAQIWSTVYPDDLITWKPIFADREWDAVLGQSTGVITSRYDTIIRLYRDFDWRNVVFRRWETVNRSGIYDSYLPTAFAFQDYPPFPAGASYNVNVGSATIAAPLFGQPYQLDNAVVKGDFSNVNFDICYLFNVENGCINSASFAVFNTSITTQDVGIIPAYENNFIQIVINNEVDRIIGNNCAVISFNNNNGVSLVIEGNTMTQGISNNSFNGAILNNSGGKIFNNQSNISDCKIVENSVFGITNNYDFKDIIGNNAVYIDGNSGTGVTMVITNNVGHSIIDNIDTTIQENNVREIFGNLGNPGATFAIENNNGESISNNTVNGSFSIRGNNVRSIISNVFEDLGEFQSNFGNNFDNNQFSNVSGKTFNRNTFEEISQCGINDEGVNKNMFLANLGMKVFTPTASMNSGSPTITMYDTVDGDVEQVLTLGVFAYTPF